MATSEAQRRAVRKYQQKMKHVQLEVKPEFYDLIKETAAQKGCSMNSFISQAISFYLHAEMYE